jgi:hypothetical protein
MGSRFAVYTADLFNVRHCDLDEVLAGSFYLDHLRRQALGHRPVRGLCELTYLVKGCE